MAHVAKTNGKQPRTRIQKAEKMVRVAPPLGGRYARSEGPGPGPERHHNGPKRS